MTFGTDLKDQIPSILTYIGDGIQSLTQFRNFIKDRTNIEREYAQKLDNLTRKYKPNSKKSVSTPTVEGQQDDWDWEDSSSTTYGTWCQLLNQTSVVAKSRLRLAEDVNTIVIDALRGVATRKEDARKKHAAFYQKLKNERDKTYADKDKAKQLYDEACAEIENLKAKINKSSGDQDKLQRALDAAHIDRDNKKNLYLLAISVANAERSKYFEDDIPVLADHLEDLDSGRILALKSILRSYINLETNLITTVQKSHDESLASIEKIDPAIDAGVFTRSALGNGDANEKAANVQFTFMPWNGGANAAETIIDRDDSLVVNESAVIFLNNKLLKDRKQLDILADDLSKRSLEMSKLEAAVKSSGDPSTPNYDKANENLLETIRDITMLSTQKVRVKSEVDSIIHCIGDDGLRAQNHDLKPSSFAIPTSCDYCKGTMWGIANKGFTCKACGFNCHAKCEMKVAPNCSKVKGKINPQPNVSSVLPGRLGRTDSVNGSVRSIPTSLTPSNISQSYTQPPVTPTTTTHAAGELRSIYSYEAQNTDELTINEGDILSIVEHDDGTGWIKAKLGNRSGLIPANYVEYIEETTSFEHNDDDRDASVIDEPTIYTVPSAPPPPPIAPIVEVNSLPQQEVVVALYDFEAVNAEELNIREGDRISVTRKDDSGWWEGTLNGQTGVFPANYVGSL